MAKKQENNKVLELEQRVADLESQLKRAVADYRNLEQRVSQGRSELTNYVGAELIRKILPALDHLEQALGGVTDAEKQSGWFKGVELAVKELNQVLQSEGLDQIATEGQFDPNLHEAVDTAEGEDNKILKVVRKGYNLNGKVLRPAGVVVGRKQDKQSLSSEEGKSNEDMSDESVEGEN